MLLPIYLAMQSGGLIAHKSGGELAAKNLPVSLRFGRRPDLTFAPMHTRCSCVAVGSGTFSLPTSVTLLYVAVDLT